MKKIELLCRISARALMDWPASIHFAFNPGSTVLMTIWGRASEPLADRLEAKGADAIGPNGAGLASGGGEVKDGVPQFAKAISFAKIEAVVTVCPHCVEQITEVSAASGVSYQCVNIGEFLSRSYQG